MFTQVRLHRDHRRVRELFDAYCDEFSIPHSPPEGEMFLGWEYEKRIVCFFSISACYVGFRCTNICSEPGRYGTLAVYETLRWLKDTAEHTKCPVQGEYLIRNPQMKRALKRVWGQHREPVAELCVYDPREN